MADKEAMIDECLQNYDSELERGWSNISVCLRHSSQCWPDVTKLIVLPSLSKES